MSVKRLCVAVTLVAIALTPPASAQMAGGHTTEYVEAHANWVAGRTKEGPFFRFFSVWRDSEPAKGSDTIAQIGTVRCRSKDDRKMFRFACTTDGRLIFLRDAAFRFDPALRSAYVLFRALGGQHRVDWTATEERPRPDWRLAGGERSMALSAAATVDARVRGRVMDQTFSTKRRRARATLRRGVEAGAIYEVGGPFVVEARTRAAAIRAIRRAIPGS